MPRRSPRTRVDRGIYRDALGYEVVARVGRRTKAKRFPLTTSHAAMRDWQDATRQTLRKGAKSPRGPLVTLADDIKAYLRRIPAGESKANRTILLAHWDGAFGTLPTLELSRAMVVQQLHTWRATHAASTCNHRLSELRRLLETQYPDAETWATSRITRFREPQGEVRDIPVELLDTLIASMPRSKSKARLWVFAATGIPPARLRRLKREHVDLADGTVYLESRRKGAGTPGRRFPFSAEARAAFEELIAVHAFGSFATESMAVVWTHALTRENKARAKRKERPLPHIRMYDIRHAFGSRLYRLTGDIRAVAEIMDISIETALRYTRAAVPQALRSAVAALDRDRIREARPAASKSEVRRPGRLLSVAPLRGTRKNKA